MSSPLGVRIGGSCSSNVSCTQSFSLREKLEIILTSACVQFYQKFLSCLCKWHMCVCYSSFLLLFFSFFEILSHPLNAGLTRSPMDEPLEVEIWSPGLVDFHMTRFPAEDSSTSGNDAGETGLNSFPAEENWNSVCWWIHTGFIQLISLIRIEADETILRNDESLHHLEAVGRWYLWQCANGEKQWIWRTCSDQKVRSLVTFFVFSITTVLHIVYSSLPPAGETNQLALLLFLQHGRSVQ